MCQMQNTKEAWGAVAKFFHWIIFAIFVAQFLMAEVMMGMVAAPENTFLGAGKWDLYGLHKSIGMLALVVIALRVGWRLHSRTVPPVTGNLLEKLGAHGAHLALYAVMIGFPISGYLMSMAGGHGITVFGLFQLPDLVGKNPDLGKLAHQIHGICGTVAYIVVAVHVGAALFHYYVKKDNVLTRMLPTRS